MDTSLFRSINNWPDSLAPILNFFSEATKTPLGKGLFLLFAIFLLAKSNTTRKAAILGGLAVVLANSTTDILKHAFPVTRPCVELADVHARTGVLTSPGTASAHSANMAALATVFILIWGWRGSFWVPIALVTGLSRIYVGVHYPSQVVFGWTCGILSGLVAVKTWEALVKRRTGNEEVAEAAVAEHRAGPG